MDRHTYENTPGTSENSLATEPLAEPMVKKGRSKSSHRILLDAQVEVIKKEIGGLETIRKKLDLSRRKICQLIMVDPSAWTRWTRPGEDAPPHIYRALQWYLLIHEKYPGLGTPYWLSSISHGTNSIKIEEQINNEFEQEIEVLRGEIEDLKKQAKNQLNQQEFAQLYRQIRQLKDEKERLRQRQWVLGGIGAILAIIALYLAVFSP